MTPGLAGVGQWARVWLLPGGEMRYINVNSAELAAPHLGSHQCSAVSPILHTGVSVLHPGRPCVLGCGWLAAGKFSSAMQTDAPGGLPRAQAWHRVAPWAGEESRERPAHFPRGLGSERVGLGRQAAEGALFRAPQSLPPAGELRASLEDTAGGSGSHCGVPLRLKASPGCVPSTWRRGQAGRALL